jgi:hypothetical protein
LGVSGEILGAVAACGDLMFQKHIEIGVLFPLLFRRRRLMKRGDVIRVIHLVEGFRRHVRRVGRQKTEMEKPRPAAGKMKKLQRFLGKKGGFALLPVVVGGRRIGIAPLPGTGIVLDARVI